MALVINCISVHGPLGNIVVVDSFVERMEFPWRMPPKWWEWRFSPDGWMIGKWRWVRFNPPASNAKPPDPAKFDRLADTNGLATVDAGTEFCMALYRRRPPNMDWSLYVLLSASPWTWTGEASASTTLEPNINFDWPKWSIAEFSATALHFKAWGYFGKKGEPGHVNRGPEGNWNIFWDAKKYTEGFENRTPYADYIYDDKPGGAPGGNPPAPFLGRHGGRG